MKTNEQIKQEIVNYLTKTSHHTFSYDDGKLFKVIKDEDKFFIVDENSHQKFKELFDFYINNYGNNAKCVLKHSLFLGRKVKSIKTNKYTKEVINELISSSKKKVSL